MEDEERTWRNMEHHYPQPITKVLKGCFASRVFRRAIRPPLDATAASATAPTPAPLPAAIAIAAAGRTVLVFGERPSCQLVLGNARRGGLVHENLFACVFHPEQETNYESERERAYQDTWGPSEKDGGGGGGSAWSSILNKKKLR